MQVHDQRNVLSEEESGANTAWLDGRASPGEDPALGTQAQTMIQGQRQYYDEVHVIKQQVMLHETAMLRHVLDGMTAATSKCM